ncbi:MAG: sn-glycerol-3-phosphate import ATP-binding protein UgpC [Hyphomicrobiaceae bacterium]
MAEIRLKGVRKVYPGGVNAIKGIDLDIADGEFIVLVGPSGCGKSTLLRMIAGLERITEGDVEIAGRRVNDVEPADRDIAMVFQNYALYPHMTVFDNMAYGLRNRRTPKDEIERRVKEAADILEIGALLTRKPRQLSGGQRQRVAMGRALVRKPAAFLFDEPLSNLDAKLRVQMRVEIRNLQRQLATTSVYVTHDQVEAMTMADRLVVMNAGIAEQIGTPRELYQKPATEFVAGFIGSPAMNFLPARATAGGGAVELAGIIIAAPGVDGLAAGQALNAGIRPEDFRIANDASGHGEDVGDAPGLAFTVELVEHLGADTIIYGRFPDAGRDRLVVRVNGDRDFAVSSQLSLRIPAGALHLFDPATGRRV